MWDIRAGGTRFVACGPNEERELETVTVWSWVQGQIVWYRNEDKVVVNLLTHHVTSVAAFPGFLI